MSDAATAPAGRLAVLKTYKLYIGGAFPRSESGRSYVVTDHKGGFAANAAMASRKDARDAVSAARKAFAGWSAATAYNRGQVLYRVAELLEGRRAQFAAEVRAAEGLSAPGRPRPWWTRRSTAGSGTPAGPTRSPRSAGRLTRWRARTSTSRCPSPPASSRCIAPQASSLLGFISVVAPAVVTGSTVVVLASERFPLPAVSLSEVLATSDVPAGVINVLTGRTEEVAPWLASHMDVNAIDLAGAPDALAGDLAVAAADNLKRVLRPGAEDWAETPGVRRMLAYLETKTVWHPEGL